MTTKRMVRALTIGGGLLIASTSALGQAGAAGGNNGAETAVELAVVNANGVFVRAGAADSYYPFGKLRRGDVVRVTGAKHNWARIATTGPAFRGFFGYVRYPSTDSAMFRLAEDGESGQTLGRLRVLAPNMNTGYEPADSWKRILTLEPNRTVDVLETTATDRTIVHKIMMPADGEGWINAAFLDPATPEQIAAWKSARPTAVARGARPGDMPTVGDAAAKPGVLGREETAVAPPIAMPTQPGSASLDASRGAPTDVLAGDVTATPGLETTTNVVTDSLNDDSLNGETTSGLTLEVTTTVVDDLPGMPVTTDSTTTTDVIERLDAPSGTARPDRARLDTPPAATTDPAIAANAPGSIAGTEMTTPTAAPVRAPARRSAELKLEGLEAAYERLRKEPIASAEVMPLRNLYLNLAADHHDNEPVSRYAKARAEQLMIWAELQERRAKLDDLRKRIDLTADEGKAMKLALEAKGVYVAVGRLTTSSVYGGGQFPRLFRVQDPQTSRTLGYLRPDAGFDLHGMLDQLVGVVGRKTQDAKLRLNVFEPSRIDLLGTP